MVSLTMAVTLVTPKPDLSGLQSALHRCNFGATFAGKSQL
jgi:hypothetical protein